MKLRTDAERRAELKRMRLVAERGQLEAERKLLRAELLGALAAADANWRQDERVLSLRSRLGRVERDWREVVEELRVLDTRPVEPPAPVPPILGGVQITNLPVMRIR